MVKCKYLTIKLSRTHKSDSSICIAPFKWNLNECNFTYFACLYSSEHEQCPGRKIYDGKICGCTRHKKHPRTCSKHCTKIEVFH